MSEILIKVNKNGSTFEVLDGVGASCLTEHMALTEKLGGTYNIEKKPEFYKTAKQQQTQNAQQL